MKKHPILSALLILFLVVFVSNYLSTRAYENSFKGKSPVGIDGAPQATEPRYTVVNRCAAKFKSTFPDQSYTTYDTETNKFSLCYFDYNTALVADRLLGDNESYLESWSNVRSFVSSLSSDFQKMCDDAGYSDIDVVVYVLYPDDVNAYYLSASHGHVVFDAIENYMTKNHPDDFVGFDLEASE